MATNPSELVGGQHWLYIVERPKCGEAEIFELRKEVSDGKMRVEILIRHRSGVCELNAAKKEVKEGEAHLLIKMPQMRETQIRLHRSWCQSTIEPTLTFAAHAH